MCSSSLLALGISKQHGRGGTHADGQQVGGGPGHAEGNHADGCHRHLVQAAHQRVDGGGGGGQEPQGRKAAAEGGGRKRAQQGCASHNQAGAPRARGRRHHDERRQQAAAAAAARGTSVQQSTRRQAKQPETSKQASRSHLSPKPMKPLSAATDRNTWLLRSGSAHTLRPSPARVPNATPGQTLARRGRKASTNRGARAAGAASSREPAPLFRSIPLLCPQHPQDFPVMRIMAAKNGRLNRLL